MPAFIFAGCNNQDSTPAATPPPAATTSTAVPAASAPAATTGVSTPAADASAEPAPRPTVTNTEPALGQTVTLPSGLKIEILREGTGPVAKAGELVTVNYTGWLTDGTKFDSSIDRGQPFQFGLGQGQVIPGWDLGVEGMKVGEKRKLIVPPDLGYGSNGAGNVIPPNSELIFEVELLNVQ